MANIVSQAESHLNREIAREFCWKLRDGWLRGFNEAWAAWPKVPESTKKAIAQIFDRFVPTVDPHTFPTRLSRQTLHIQLFNIAGRDEREPFQFLEQILRIEPFIPRAPLRTAIYLMPEEDDPRALWGDVIRGMTASPDWNLIVGAWTLLTKRFREIVRVATLDQEAPPKELIEPAGFAWLDRVAEQAALPDEQLLLAYRDIDSRAADGLVDALLEQHAAWRAASLLPKNGCVQKIDDFAPTILARFASFHRAFDRKVLKRLSKLDITYPFGVRRRENQSPDPESSKPGEEVRFLPEGFTLVDADAGVTSFTARARTGELLLVAPHQNPLVVVLDINLASDDFEFLGITGTRLRICDWASHMRELCFTKAGLNGEVELLGNASPPPPYEHIDMRPLVPGRKLISPFEGMRDAGYTGSNERIGGAPNWEQYPEVPQSPVDQKLMTFIAQFPHPVGGTAYVFFDYANRVATVVKQWD